MYICTFIHTLYIHMFIHMFIYVWTYICMNVHMHECTYIWTYVCMNVRMYERIYVQRMYKSTYVRRHSYVQGIYKSMYVRRRSLSYLRRLSAFPPATMCYRIIICPLLLYSVLYSIFSFKILNLCYFMLRFYIL